MDKDRACAAIVLNFPSLNVEKIRCCNKIFHFISHT